MTEVVQPFIERKFYNSPPYARTVDLLDNLNERMKVRLAIAGQGSIPKTQTIFASNHHSPKGRPELDIITNARAFRAVQQQVPATERQLRFVAKQELFKPDFLSIVKKLVPPIGAELDARISNFIKMRTGLEMDQVDLNILLRGLGALPVRRGSVAHDQIRGIRQAKTAGHDLLVFPEGEVVHGSEGQLGQLGGGVIYFAQKGEPNLPITPVSLIYGTERFAGLILQDILVRYDEPLDVSELESPEALVELTQAMQANQDVARHQFEEIYHYVPGHRPATELLQQVIGLRERPAVTIIKDA